MPDAAPVTLTRHIMLEQRRHDIARGDFSGLLSSIALAGKIISREVNKAGLADVLGMTGATNVQGEEVRKLDEYAQNTIVNILGRSGLVCIMGSEEEADPIEVPEEWRFGTYVLVFDPLDGSSNIDANVSVGTIFGVYRRRDPEGDPSEADILQPGRDMVGAGYIVYGSSTVFVYSAGAGVHGFTLDPEIGEFLLSHPNVRTPERGRILSINESYWEFWKESVHDYLDYSQEIDKETKRPYNRRYIGSLVADFHRNLMYGGVFLYPADTRDPKKPQGKLRLLYEAAPLAYVVEQAGGAASDGMGRILDIDPEHLHQRTPLIIGSRANVEEAVRFLAG